ncbi:MAG: hypothetical protein GY788_13210 [bacterium]|nr:hypothetical protein [bacterium]
MPELKAQLRTYFETIAPPVEARFEPRQPSWRERPLMAWTVGAAIVAVPTLVLWVLFGRGVEPEPTIPPATTLTTIVEMTLPPDSTVTTVPPTTTSNPPPTTALPGEADTIGAWIPVPDGPWAFPHTIRTWTGNELLVFSEYVTGLEPPTVGLAHNPATGEWRELASAPELRGQPASVWTGSQLLVWGGLVESAFDPAPSYVLSNTGFAYDPVTDIWSTLPTAPLEPQTSPFHVWTGEELIVWGGSAVVDDIFLGGTTAGGAYNPVTGEWRVLAESPLGRRNPGVAVWTGTEMIIGGNGDHTDGAASWAAYNPAPDSWRELPDPPIRAGGVYIGVWTGTEVIFSSEDQGASDSRQPTSELYAFNPTTDVWRQTASPEKSVFQAGAVWTGRHVIYWGESGYPGDEFTEIAYDPEADAWSTLAPSPLTDRFADQSTTVIGPNTVLIWGGADYGPDGFSDGAILVIDGGADRSPRADTELISSLFPLVGDISRAADLPWDPAGVGLGLGDSIVRTVEPADLADPSTWELEVSDYNGATGPFSIIDAIARLAPIDDILVQEGPHDHCTSAPKPAPSGFELLRRVSVQPSSFDSCLQWWTIDLFVTTQGNIRAITYDFWEP